MRFRQLVEDNYVDSLKDAITSMLVAVAAEGVFEIDTRQLIIDLQQDGFSIDKKNIFRVLNELPIVSSADSKTIKIKTNDTSAGQLDVKKQQTSAVDKMAQKQAKKDLGL